MWNALGKLAGAAGDDVQGFANQLQNLAGSGGFNPFSLLTGDQELLGAFLAPLSPQLVTAIERFQRDGGGPLQSVIEQFKQQGLGAAEATVRAREVFAAARGMCVIVLAHEQGVSSIPQLHYERVDRPFMEHLLGALGDASPLREGARLLFDRILAAGESGQRFPRLVAGIDAQTPEAFWPTLAERMLDGLDEGILPGQEGRLADLGWWCAEALGQMPAAAADGHGLLTLARCRLLAGEVGPAIGVITRLLDDFEPEDEETLRLVEGLAKAAIAQGQPRLAADAIVARWSDLTAIFGGPCYEAALARLRCLAASQATAEELIQAVDLLRQADRKAFRHDLNREPLWLVVGEAPGELLDTAEAAERLGRSITFVAKRLEQATIPVFREGEQLRIPAKALEAWRSVMEHFSLFD